MLTAKFCCVCAEPLAVPLELDGFSEPVCENCNPPGKPAHPDPTMTAHSPTLLSRFRVSLLAPEWKDHSNVAMTVFREESLSDAEYAAILDPLDSEDGYLRSAVDDTFSAAEVEILRGFFAEIKPTWKFSATPAKPIEQNEIGCGALPVGGPTDFLSWENSEGKKGPAEMPVSAYYDLRAAESGPFANGSWESSPATITEAHWQAMQRVVEYLERDEIRNWVEAGQPDKHIWLSVRELQDLLKQAGKIPNIANFWETADGDLVSDGHGDD